jgi:hypothetical protein
MGELSHHQMQDDRISNFHQGEGINVITKEKLQNICLCVCVYAKILPDFTMVYLTLKSPFVMYIGEPVLRILESFQDII